MKKIFSVILTIFMIIALTGCVKGNVSYDSFYDKGSIEIKGLDEESEGTMDFTFKSGKMTIQLSSGTIDMTIIEIEKYGGESNDDFYDEIGVLYEGKGLKDGDVVTFKVENGSIVVRLTGYKATGKISIEEDK